MLVIMLGASIAPGYDMATGAISDLGSRNPPTTDKRPTPWARPARGRPDQILRLGTNPVVALALRCRSHYDSSAGPYRRSAQGL